MSILVPFLAVLLVAGLAAYHRMRLATWAAISACALVACWLLGANAVACVVAAVIVAAITLPLLLSPVRKALVTAPMMKFFRKVLPPLSQTERIPGNRLGRLRRRTVHR